MRILPSWWLGGAAAAAVLIGTVYVGSVNLARTGGASEFERLERLTADREYVDRRQESVRALAADVVAGRLSLRGAAEDLRLLDVNSPEHLRLHIEYQDGRTEEERHCRSMVAHVRAYLGHDDRAPAVLARLEAELDDLVQGRAAPLPRVTRRHSRPPTPDEVAQVGGPPD
jgi:hypothetical protein